MMDLNSIIWIVAAATVGMVTGRPLGTIAKSRATASGWSRHGFDSVGTALHMGAVGGLSYGLATATSNLPSAILYSLAGGVSMGFALSFRHILDGVWDNQDAEPAGDSATEEDTGESDRNE